MKRRGTPARMCVACRQMRDKRELLRVTLDPSGAAALDLTGKAPGRGAYVCSSTICVAGAQKKKKLEHALGGADCSAAYAAAYEVAENAQIAVQKELDDDLRGENRDNDGKDGNADGVNREKLGFETDESRRHRRALGIAGIAARKRSLAIGQESCEAAIRGENVRLVLVARDASQNTADKLRRASFGRDIKIVAIADKAELGRAAGKAEISAMALTDERLEKRLAEILGESSGGDI